MREVAKKKQKKTGEENNRGAIREKKEGYSVYFLSCAVWME